jgi:SAM-dependent methyltransferase
MNHDASIIRLARERALTQRAEPVGADRTDSARDATTPMHPGMVADYEAAAEPLTRQCLPTAFAMIGDLSDDLKVLDVAAGPGGLSLAAAEAGAHVLATDMSPAMVARLAERLQPYPRCTAQVMDGQALDLPDGTFDATFSLFGVVNFPDWRQGLRELARVTRTDGHCCVSTWQDPRTVGAVPFLLEALRTTSSDTQLLPSTDDSGLPRSSDALREEMTAAGIGNVEVREVEVIWTSPTIDTMLAQQDQLFGFMPAYAALSPSDRDQLGPALRGAARIFTQEDSLRTTTTALVAAGRRT